MDLTSDGYSTSTNVDILQIKFFNKTKSYTCQAQNSFGLVVHNITVFLRDSFCN